MVAKPITARLAPALAPALALALVLAPVLAPPLHAQRPAIRVHDIGSLTFDEREGLPSSAIYDVRRMRNGELWLGASTGAYRFDGGEWTLVPAPLGVTNTQVRMLAEAPDGTRWFSTRFEVYREKGDDRHTYTRRDGLPATPIYSIVHSDALGGEATVLVGTGGGLFRLTPDDRFVAVPIPDGFSPAGLMLATRRESDGRESLWLASIKSGVARYRHGVWTRWDERDALHPVVESVTPSALDDSVEAIAATYRGAYALLRDRWVRISSAEFPVNRGMRVRSGGRYETWIGGLSGRVLRERVGGGWDTLSTNERRTISPVIALRAIDDGIGDATVYAGFRGGGLTRLRTGRVGHVVVGTEAMMRNVTAVSAITSTTSEPSFALARVGVGIQRPPRLAVDAISEPVDVFDILVYGFADARADGGDLWASTIRGLFRLRGDTWVRDPSAPFPDSLASVVRGALPDGGVGIIASAHGGSLAYRDRAGWHRIPGTPEGTIQWVDVDTVGGEPSLWVNASDRIMRYGYRTQRWSRLEGLTALMALNTLEIEANRLASGEEVLWVANPAYGLGRRAASSADTTWRWLVPDNNRALPTFHVTAMAFGADGRMHVGTERGLLTLRPGLRLADSVAIEDVYVASDGLPHEYVTSLSASSDGQYLWVGTLEGLGALRLQRGPEGGTHRPVPQLVARLATAAGTLVRDGATIRYANRAVTFAYSLDTRHRESATRYRFLFDGRQVTPDAWSAQRTVSLPALGAGVHEAQLWAMDWRGRVAGPVTFRFTVASPWWRSRTAIALYVAAFFVLLFAFDRWRQAALHRRAAELEENERRLAASEERFRRLFEDGADAQLLVRDGIVFDANPAAADLLGGGRRDVLIRRRLDTFLAEAIPVHSRTLEGRAPDPTETTATTANDEVIPVAVRRISVPASDAPFDCVELQDLREAQRLERERLQLEHQLRESQRLEALGNLAGGVAHDFNNLLTVIQGHTELLRHGNARSADDEESLGAIHQASDRARGIVRQILTFSRRRPPQRIAVDLGAMLRETGAMLRASIPTTVAVSITDHSDGARMIGDPTEIHQLLLNLGANAEYAMRGMSGGTLAFTLDLIPAPRGGGSAHEWSAERCLRLRVRDTGVGMSSEVQRRIFEPFFTTKPVGEGTGLGLSVLHGIVTAHGGTVTVSSDVGKGTTFEILFPALAPAAIPAGGEPSPPMPPSSLTPTRDTILIVDDEVSVATVTALLLENAGYRCIRCHAPDEALRLFEDGVTPIQLVITDQTMPGMTGDVLAQRIHQLAPHVPILIATGYSQKLLGFDLATQGVVGLLEKPFLEAELLRAVAAALPART